MPRLNYLTEDQMVVGNTYVIDTRDFGYAPTGLNHGDLVTLITVNPRTSSLAGDGYSLNVEGPDGQLRGPLGYEWIDLPTTPQEAPMKNPDLFRVGDRVRVTDLRTQIGGHPIGSGRSEYVGQEGTVQRVFPNSEYGDGRPSYMVVIDGEDDGSSWTHPALDLVAPAVVDDEAPKRPTIDFSGDSRATARDYASRHISRVNKPETNEVLLNVSLGLTVDAYDLNEALLDAMRGAATRAGQSPLRRTHGKEIAYLGHIVHAVLANHADNLPAYEQGERSRVAHEAKGEIARLDLRLSDTQTLLEAEIANRNALESDNESLKLRVGNLASERATLTQAASDERRRLCAEIDALKVSLADVTRSLNVEQAAAEYVDKQFLSEQAAAQVAGFKHGFLAEHDYRNEQ